MNRPELAPAERGNSDAEKKGLFSRYETVLEDPIFQKISTSIDASWGALDEEKRHELLDAYKNLLEAITKYASNYRALKNISHFKPSIEAGLESVKRYQGEVSEADRRERELHEAFLDSVNILSRRMKALGLDNSWRADDMIYPDRNDRALNRQKVKQWMFRVFAEDSA